MIRWTTWLRRWLVDEDRQDGEGDGGYLPVPAKPDPAGRPHTRHDGAGPRRGPEVCGVELCWARPGEVCVYPARLACARRQGIGRSDDG